MKILRICRPLETSAQMFQNSQLPPPWPPSLLTEETGLSFIVQMKTRIVCSLELNSIQMYLVWHRFKQRNIQSHSKYLTRRYYVTNKNQCSWNYFKLEYTFSGRLPPFKIECFQMSSQGGVRGTESDTDHLVWMPAVTVGENKRIFIPL
jgi:hypothetical protein